MAIFDLILMIAFGVCCLFFIVCFIGAAICDHKFFNQHWALVVDGEEFAHVTSLDIDEKHQTVSFYVWDKWVHVKMSYIDLRYMLLFPGENPKDPEA